MRHSLFTPSRIIKTDQHPRGHSYRLGPDSWLQLMFTFQHHLQHHSLAAAGPETTTLPTSAPYGIHRALTYHSEQLLVRNQVSLTSSQAHHLLRPTHPSQEANFQIPRLETSHSDQHQGKPGSQLPHEPPMSHP